MTRLVASSEDLVVYECCVLYPSNLSQKEEQDLLKVIEGHFAEHGGKQLGRDAWGRRGMAYPVKGHEEGNYVIYYEEFPPQNLKELDRALRITPNVLRHMIIKPSKYAEMVSYADRYEQWLKDRRTAEEDKSKRHEEELQRKVTERAKQRVKKVEKAEAEKTEKRPAGPVEKERISEELDRLISDKDLEL